MHTLRYVIGDSIFFPTLKHLATDSNTTYMHTVNTDDVQRLFSQASGMDLSPLFHLVSVYDAEAGDRCAADGATGMLVQLDEYRHAAAAGDHDG